MGNKASRQSLGSKHVKGRQTLSTADAPKSTIGDDPTLKEPSEFHNCCGIKVQKNKKNIPFSNSPILNWKDNFVSNCKSIANEFQWAKELISLVGNCELAKSKYFSEVNILKSFARVDQPTETNILHTPAEVQEFKNNLKRSVIMSFTSSKPSVDQKNINISRKIEQKGNKKKLQIQRSSYLNRQFNKYNNNSPYRKSFGVISKYSLSKSVISMIDDTISSVMGNQKEFSKQSARDLQIFLKFSMVLQKHFSDYDCIFGKIKENFINYVKKSYENIKQTSDKIGDFIDNIKQFLVILKQAVLDFYDLGSFAIEQPPNLFIANDQNILSTCTAIIFKDNQFYNHAFSIINQYCFERQKNFNRIIDSLKDVTPQFFLIKDRFCLNRNTINSYIQSLNNSESQEKIVDNIQFKDLVIDNQQPYKICMNQLRELQKSKSPISKMKAIIACSESISSQIQKFYQLHGLRRQKWMLDADQVLSIFCYILVKGRIQNLLSHLFILQNFSTNHQMISMSGYYLSVINCAVEQLQGEYDQEEIIDTA